MIVADDQTHSLLSAVRSIAVGSTNPVKMSAARAVLEPLAPRARFASVAVASTVADQPFGDDETIRGARARAVAARDALGADLGVGIEGGVVEQPDGEMRTCAWAVIVDAQGRSGVGGSLAMPLPRHVVDRQRAYEVLVTYALAPFLTPRLYSDERRAGISPVY
jgi:inosine/xanthosine triphosphatase